MSKIQIFTGIGHVFIEVAIALLPLTIMFLILQFWVLKFPKQKVLNILKGMILTFLGLSIFLQGVYVGFLPVGEIIGQTLGVLSNNWVLIPIGFALGFAAAFAEPAVRVLNHEVEKASGGYIPQQVLLYTLSFGVAISVALSMCRIVFGISLWYFVIPGYIIAFILMRYSTPTFAAIAFDSGGVATGPMVVSFILTMALGVASAVEGNALMEGFGTVALVALSPILSVMLLGQLYKRKERRQNAQKLEDE